MIVLLTSPVRSASSARLSAPSPCRKAVRTARARSAAGTPLTEGAVPRFFGTRHTPMTPAMGLPGPLWQAIDVARGAGEQCCLLALAVGASQALERVPDAAIARHALVYGEVALEQAAVRPEQVDAGRDVGAPRVRQRLRRRGRHRLVEAEAADVHGEPAQLHAYVGQGRQPQHPRAPLGQRLGL